MPDPLYWRLIYADDHVEDEPIDNASIRLSHRGAVMLMACAPERGPNGEDLRKPVLRVNLFDGERLYAPVWYRKRSMSAGTGDAALRLDATVLGRVREGEHNFDGTLWASLDGKTFGDCPAWAMDQTAIEGQLTGV